jgi:hypothetical protein
MNKLGTPYKCPNEQDLGFMRWLATMTSPFGTTVVRISVVVGRLERNGMIARFDKRIVLTGKGWRALHESGFRGIDE